MRATAGAQLPVAGALECFTVALVYHQQVTILDSLYYDTAFDFNYIFTYRPTCRWSGPCYVDTPGLTVLKKAISTLDMRVLIFYTKNNWQSRQQTAKMNIE